MRHRKWVVLAAVCAVALMAATPAGAREGVDRSFGGYGVVRLDALNEFGEMRAMKVAPDRAIYLLGSLTRCSTTCSQELYLFRRHADGSEDPGFGEGGVVTVAKALGAGWIDELAVDAEGRALVAFPVPGGVSVVRVRPDGALDSSFGQGGATTVRCACEGASALIEFDRRGRIFVVVGYQTQGPFSPDESTTTILVSRLLPHGSADPAFAQAEAVSATHDLPHAAITKNDGSLILMGAEDSPAGLYLMRVRADGTLDHRVERANHRALTRVRLAPRRYQFARVGGLVPRRGGVVEVLGRTVDRGFIFRVLPSGHLDPGFGRNGVKGLQWRIDAAVPAPRGKVFVTAAGSPGPEAALLLDARGNLDDSFRGGRPLILERWFEPDLALQGRRPLLLKSGVGSCRVSCPPMPALMRLTALRFAEGKRRGR